MISWVGKGLLCWVGKSWSTVFEMVGARVHIYYNQSDLNLLLVYLLILLTPSN